MATTHGARPGSPPARTRAGRPSSAQASSARPTTPPATPPGSSPRVRAGGGAFTRGSVIRSPRGNPRRPISRCGGVASAVAKYRRPARCTTASSGAALMTTRSPRRSAAILLAPSTRAPAGSTARKRSSKCSLSSSSSGAVQSGASAPEKREITQRSWSRAWLSGSGRRAQACFSPAQLGRLCSRAMAAWASCRVPNSPAARRRFASSFRNRRLGRTGSERDPPDMAVLPSRPGSACFGRERLAVVYVDATGELAALSADPEAAGTTSVYHTPARGRGPS